MSRSGSGNGKVCIFKDVTIKIDKGEFVTCIGHSGCGKSTLLNMIAGLETMSEGGIILKWPGGDRSRPRPHGRLPEFCADAVDDGV